ncbi:MAG: extracellular solute-binding protein [Oscillospiraceae bacterium]|nr:extracellular solute-binding protein [Oscillospiraceae bacterium]
MKHTRAMLSGILAASMLLSVAGCSGSESSSGAASSGSTASTASGSSASQAESGGKKSNAFPLVTEPASVSVFTNDDNGVDLSQNWFTQYYENLTGITVNWSVVNSDQYLEKLNLMMAGGDEMDIYTTKNKTLSKTLVYKYGTQGIILPINSFFDTCESYYLDNILSQDEAWRTGVTAPNGDIYGFNDVGSCFHCSYPVKMWVNKVWMDNLGITPPTTPDEFYDMLVRFKNEDVNGNGDPNDEVPLSNCTEATGSSSYMAGYLMNAFTYSNPRTKYLYVKDGSAAVSYNQEGWREGLRYLNKLYSEGLMDPESYIQDRTTMKARNDSGEHPIFGAVPAQHTTVITNGNLDDRWKEYIALPPLTGPDGLCITTNTSLSNYDNFRTMISGSSKNPELAFRFCDGLFASQEIGLLHGFGEENVRWHYAKEGELGKDGQQALYSNVTEDDKIPQEGEPYYNNYCWGSMFANYATNHSKWASPNDMSIPGTASFERYLYVNTEPYEAKKADISMVMPSFFFSEEDNAEIARLQTTIINYVDESTAAFVTGNKSIDNDWDAYITELGNLGLADYLAIYQRYYDEYKKG